MSIALSDPAARAEPPVGRPVHSTYADWEAFVRFCEELGFGEVEKLKIQDGRPVLAEVVTKKIRFTR